jgi:hypothetical protein
MPAQGEGKESIQDLLSKYEEKLTESMVIVKIKNLFCKENTH